MKFSKMPLILIKNWEMRGSGGKIDPKQAREIDFDRLLINSYDFILLSSSKYVSYVLTSWFDLGIIYFDNIVL